ncbi:MAG: triose-phosphate isomerase [bacterium]
MRKKIIAGNWKMNLTVPEAVELASGIVRLSKGITHADIVICPAYVCLSEVSKTIKDTNVCLGAQDMHWEKSGAFTGKVSAEMLKSCGVEYVIIGHSEQRTFFYETNDSVNKKVKAALDSGLKPIVCVGETREEREADLTKNVVKSHVEGAYNGISENQALQTVIAYEPVWAIGTGLTATPEQAQEVHQFIRNLINDKFSGKLADALRIQYGGSMKPENAKELMEKADIDGGLIGGAALKPESFLGIVQYNK